MNTKNRLIEQLLRVAKRHKILTYPVLALVALISIFSYFFNWSTGAGKRVVAVVMVMVMLVSQSYFLTSSADNREDTVSVSDVVESAEEEDTVQEPESTTPSGGETNVTDDSQNSENDTNESNENVENVLPQDEPSESVGDLTATITPDGDMTDGEESDVDVNLYDIPSALAEDNISVWIQIEGVSETLMYNNIAEPQGDGSYKISASFLKTTKDTDLASYTRQGHYECDGWYTDRECTKKILDGQDYIAKPINGENVIRLYAKRKLVKYKVTINVAGKELFDGLQVRDNHYSGVVKEFDIEVDDSESNNPTCSFTIENPRKKGYTIKGVEFSDSSNTGGSKVVPAEDGTSNLVVTLSGSTNYAQTITLTWTPDTFYIRYSRSDNEDEQMIRTLPVIYDEGTIASGADVQVYEKPGYVFHHWKLKGKDTAGTSQNWDNIMPGELIKDYDNTGAGGYSLQDLLYDNQDTLTLWPEYSYKEIVLEGTEEDRNIVYQYNDPDKTRYDFKGHYKGTVVETEENFTYSIESIKVGGTDITSTIQSQYGIIVNGGNKLTIQPVSNGPTKRTPDNTPITVTCKITDNNITDVQEQADHAVTFNVTITVTKRLISVNKEQSQRLLKKIYDGNTTCDVKDVYLQTEIPGVVVYFAEGVYEKPYAGSQPVTLRGGSKLVKDPEMQNTEEDPDNYTLSESATWTVPGLIQKRLLYVTTSVKYTYDRDPQYVRAGENNPTISVNLDEQANSLDVNYGLIAAHEGLMSEIVEAYAAEAGNPNNERDDDKLAKSYEGKVITYNVEARAKEDLSDETKIANNYEIVFDTTSGRSTKASYELRLEEPIEGTNYQFVDAEGIIVTLVGDYWLSGEGNQIIPTGGYNRIRLEGQTGWSSAIELTESNTEDGVITFQLYDTRTGAFTSLKELKIKVDANGPQFVEVTVEKEGTSNPGDGFYFPSEGSNVSFGHYFNNTVYLAVTYYDNRFMPKNLYYTFSGTLGSSQKQMKEFTDIGNGYATATIEILKIDGLDKRGTIEVYADDYAGNESKPVNLRCKNVTGDEWAVESTEPTIIDKKITVKSGEVTVQNNSNNYYANCTAYLTAKDVTSGIYGVTWYVNGEQVPKRVTDTTRKLEEASFELPVNDEAFPTEDGKYRVYATVTDNAGNVSEPTNTFNFWVDDVKPILEVDDDYKDKVAQQIKITFRAYDVLSGIDQISVYDENGNLYGKQVVTERQEKSADGKYTIYHCYFEVSEKGVYKIVVKDKAGNFASEIINLGGVSADMPRCPEVTFDPEPNEKGWITSKEAKAHLENVTLTKNEEMEAATHYRWWMDGESEPRFASSLSSKVTYADVKLPEGIVHLRVWSQSDTGVQCAGAQSDSHLYKLYIDGTAPKITYQLQRGSGNSLLVTFTITDNVENVDQVSGVDKDTIKILHGNEPVLISLEELESGDGYTGSFVITEEGNYTIQAADIAGNVSDVEAFSPMSMKLNAVKNLTDSTATVGAKIYKGTHAIKTASIVYRKSTDTNYTQTDAMPILDTASGNMTISAVLNGLVSGTDYVYKVIAVSEGNEVLEYEGYFRTLSDADKGVTITGIARYADNRNGFITVDLIRGNNNIRAIEMEVGVEKDNIFTFTKVPDGSYNLVATGYEQTEPDRIYTKSVRVLVEGGKIIYPEEGISLILAGVSASTSVDIETNDTPDISVDFNWMDNLLTDEDRELIENGGTVEYRLCAKMIRITNIETAALSAMYAVAGTDKVVGAYLDLTLYKIVTDKDGNVTKKPVSELLGGASVSVTIPLGDMTGKSGLMVVRIHQAGSNYTGRYLPDQDINPSTYTVTTNQFSTYAVLYDRTQGNDVTTGTTPGGRNVVNSKNKTFLTKDVAAEEMSADEDVNTTPGNSNNPNTSVGSLRNASSAKTGDETPIALAGMLMLFAMGGFVILRKKAYKK